LVSALSAFIGLEGFTQNMCNVDRNFLFSCKNRNYWGSSCIWLFASSMPCYFVILVLNPCWHVAFCFWCYCLNKRLQHQNTTCFSCTTKCVLWLYALLSAKSWWPRTLSVSVPTAFFCSHSYSSESNHPAVGTQDLVDIDVFLDATRVIDSLQNKEIAPALAWCAENKSRLKKSKVCVMFGHFITEFHMQCSEMK
jgi:hypothetical protein